MQTPVIGIIGAGNMGHSLLGGLIKDNYPGQLIWLSDPHEEKLTNLKQTFNIHTTTDNVEVARNATVIILAVKPQILTQVLAQMRDTVASKKPLIISIAAGVKEKHIQTILGGDLPIVRCMPNTPALIGCGMTALYANQYVNPAQCEQAESILRAVGTIVWLQQENLMDVVTALSGSGPAYFFLMMEALQEAGEQLGLDTDTARLLTLQTALGATKMAIESGKTLAELRYNVTSPGGTTERALAVLEEHNLRHIFKQAVLQAKLRSEELAQLTGN